MLPEPLAVLALQLLAATRPATPPPAPAAPRPGCSPAGSPASPVSSCPPRASACTRPRHPARPGPLRPRCSSWPPSFPPPSWPACSASTSRSPSSGSSSPPATGPPTPPTSAAGPRRSPFRHVTKRQPRRDRRPCPVCGGQMPDRDRTAGGRPARYCSGACKAKAYRDRQQAGQSAQPWAARRPRQPPGTPAPSRSASRPATSSATLADTASGQQALFTIAFHRPPAPGPPTTARTLHLLITELAALAAASTVTKHATKHQAQGGTTRTSSLFDDSRARRITTPRIIPIRTRPGQEAFRQF